MKSFELTPMKIGLFFTNADYRDDDDILVVSLQKHLDDVVNKGTSPDCQDSFEKLSKAVDAARSLSDTYECVLADLETGNILELFEVSPVE